MATRTLGLALSFLSMLSASLWAQSVTGWPQHADFDKWAAKMVRIYDDPAIKCNKVTGIDTTAVGAIRVKGVWCGQLDGLGSPGMVAAIRMIGDAVNPSFRREFPKCKGPIAVSLWDKAGVDAFGSRDCQ